MYSAVYGFLSGLYGQLRGYNRLRIRNAARVNASAAPDALAARGAALFARRVTDALRRFPGYARKVRAHMGIVPRDAAGIAPRDLPVWTRDDQKAFFEALRGPPLPGCFAHATGGSTGVPMRFHVTRESYEWRCAVSDRGYAWAGAEEGRRSLYVWGGPAERPAPGARLKAEVHHRLQRRAYFDSFRFGDAEKRMCVDLINRRRPAALVGYAGNLVALARHVRDNPGCLRRKARTAVTAAEGLQAGQRELIEKHLAAELFMSYGSREFMLIGMECRKHRGYHVASDNLHVEVADEQGVPCPPGVTGRILVTDLRNAANPFIRYEIGDLGAVAGGSCPCGLPFPLLERVDGRVQETLLRTDGQRMTALFIPHLMKEFPWIEGYQIAQSRPEDLEVRVISAAGLPADGTARVAVKLKEKLGADMRIVFRRVTALARGPAGKTPIVTRGEDGNNP